MYTKEEVVEICKKIMNLGMCVRQDQLNSQCDKSGNQVLEEWIKLNLK